MLYLKQRLVSSSFYPKTICDFKPDNFLLEQERIRRLLSGRLHRGRYRPDQRLVLHASRSVHVTIRQAPVQEPHRKWTSPCQVCVLCCFEFFMIYTRSIF